MDKIIIENDIDDNIVIFSLDNDNSVWIDKYFVDQKSSESVTNFCNMLRDGFENCKEKGCETHKQLISCAELENSFLANDERWEVIDKNDDYVIIECDINDAAICIIETFFGQSLDEE
ncbi:hypothetical protein BMW23_0914 [Bodo saltans virus]|jgi:hypothetical protein|uniref:Uncharacterized protein n=1 Tax=Bodo saltans virus TaxID=2024608 RepID=A0A2H4UW95_9VIRU|nr:hypothetical protein QJ851_gp0896 [Bodo saltans virus]ATZ80959.1 hypothetical protein BMW23_0914 [Bodo saltans virus]